MDTLVSTLSQDSCGEMGKSSHLFFIHCSLQSKTKKHILPLASNHAWLLQECSTQKRVQQNNYSIKLPMKDGIPELRPCRGALEFKPNCMDNCYPVLPETKMPTFSSIGKHVPLLQVSGFKGWDGVFWPCANQSALMMMMKKKTMNMNMNI